jgi:hypothetical protein
LLNHGRKAFVQLHDHFFPLKPLAANYDFFDLVKTFSSSTDPILEFRQTQRQDGIEVTMAMAMAHNAPVDWEKVSSSYPNDDTGKNMSLQPFFRDTKEFSKIFVATMQPSKGASSSAPPTNTTATEVP